MSPTWWKEDPVRWVRDVAGAEPWSKQAEILEAVRDCRRVSVRSCNGSGKTFIAAHVVLWWLASFEDSIVVTTAPTDHQVKDVLWREIRSAYRGCSDVLGGKLGVSTLNIADKHYAVGLSTDTPERFQGFHEGHILFVVDEASGVREGIFEAVEASMTSAGAHVLLIGNPTMLSGTFYESFHRRSAQWRTIAISAFDTPNVLAGDVIVPKLVAPKWINESRENWGEDNPIYQVRVLGEFPSQADDTLISLSHVDEAIRRQPINDEKAVYEIGVDVARFGTDRTVICVRRGPDLVDIQSFNGLDVMTVTDRVMETARRFPPWRIRVDEVGVGGGVVDALRRGKVKGVEGVNVGLPALDKERYANLRAELFEGLRQRFKEGRISMPDHPDLVSELVSIRYEFTPTGQLKLEAKDEMRAHGGRSPDHADALALAFAVHTREPATMY